MEPEAVPGAPDFIPADIIAEHGVEARKTIHAQVPRLRPAPSASTLDLWRACLIGMTGALVLLTAGFGVLYLTMVARGLVDVVVVAGGILLLLWAVYFATCWRAANRFRMRRR